MDRKYAKDVSIPQGPINTPFSFLHYAVLYPFQFRKVQLILPQVRFGFRKILVSIPQGPINTSVTYA